MTLHFQRSIKKTYLLDKNNFISEDTIEPASHFICKDCLQTYYDTIEW